MPDLGLNSLTDDQLLDLLVEACAELGQRDPVVRNLAQKSIYSEAERIKIFKESIEEAIEAAKKTYETSIRQESRDLVNGMVKRGEWMPIDSTAEAKLAIESEREVRQQMIREAEASLNAQGGSVFYLNVQPSSIAVSFMSAGTRQTKTAGRISPVQISGLIQALEKAIL